MKLRRWRLVTLLGALLTAFGVTAFYVDVAAHFRFDIIEQHYTVFALALILLIMAAVAREPVRTLDQ